MNSTDPKTRLIFGMLWTLSGNGLASIAALISTVLLARLLSAEELGAYFLLLSLVSMAAVFAQFGLSRSMVRLVAESVVDKETQSPRQIVRSGFIIGSMSTIFVCSILYFYGIEAINAAVLNYSNIIEIKPIIVIWVIMIVFRGLMTESLRGLQNFKLATLFGDPLTRTLLAFTFFVIWLVYGTTDLYFVALATVACIGFVLILGLRSLYRKISIYPKHGDVKYSDIVSLSWPLLIITLTNIALTQADIWIIGAFHSQSEVALYGAAARLVLLVSISFTIVNAAVPPLIAELYKSDNKQHLESLVRTAATFAAIPSSIILVTIFLYSEQIMVALYGETYREGALVLMILSVGQFINVCTGSAGAALSMTGHQRILMNITTANAILMLLGGILVAPNYGALGVAVVAASALTLTNLLAVWMVRKRLGILSYADFKLIKMKNLKLLISIIRKRVSN